MHWAAKNGSVSTIEALKAIGARLTIEAIEAIEGWTSDLVFIFYYNSPALILRGNEMFELVVRRYTSIDILIFAIIALYVSITVITFNGGSLEIVN